MLRPPLRAKALSGQFVQRTFQPSLAFGAAAMDKGRLHAITPARPGKPVIRGRSGRGGYYRRISETGCLAA